MLNVAQISLLMLFHPKDALDIIKRERSHFRIGPVVLLVLLLAIVNYTYIFYVSYVLGSKTVSQANLLLELAVASLPLLTWVVAAYATTAVVVGECSLTEFLTASVYCLSPVIVFKPLLGLLSHALTIGEADIFHGLSVLMYVWMVILMLLALKRLNDYSLAKTVVVTLITVVVMLIIWAVILLVITLFAQVVYFVQELIREFQLKY